MPTLAEKAQTLLALHQKGSQLLLPNAWDVASARVIEEAGFPAIATTSSGVAFSLGYADGQNIAREEMLAVVARIAKGVNVPVTADVEAGYGPSPDDVAETIRGVIAAGAVGVNLEDNTGYPNPLFTVDAQVARIRAARAAADAAGVHVVINARTDVYLYGIGEESGRFDDTVTRGRSYLEAGADCIFVPGVVDPALIEQLVASIPGPINILVGANAPSAPDLFRLGVVRISLGGAVMQTALGFVQEIARELRDQGTYTNIARYGFTHSQTTKLITRG